MKKIIFFSTPASSHILAEEPIIRGLIKKGFSVDWYSSERFRKIIIESGATFKPYKEDFDATYSLSEVTDNFYILMKTILSISRDCFIEYVDEVKREDPIIILHDSMCSFAKNIARKLGKKSVCLCPTLAFNFFTSTFTSMMFPIAKLGMTHCFGIMKEARQEKRFRKQYNLPRLKLIDLFVNSGDKTIVLSPPEFQPFVWSFPKSYKFVGSTINGRRSLLSQQYEKCEVYMSLGSIFTENNDFINKVINSKALKNKKVVVNVGKAKFKSRNRNLKLLNYTDQIALLKKTKVFVNHGGMNSVYESLYYKVPQICFPQQEEQRMVAKIVQNKHLGLYVRHFDPDKIDYYIAKLGKNIRNAHRYSNYLKNMDGTKNAIREIEELID